MTYHERNRRIRHLWSIGFNTYEIAKQMNLSESFVDGIVFDSLVRRRPKRVAA